MAAPEICSASNLSVITLTSPLLSLDATMNDKRWGSLDKAARLWDQAGRSYDLCQAVVVLQGVKDKALRVFQGLPYRDKPCGDSLAAFRGPTAAGT